jgi:hypothetical protein
MLVGLERATWLASYCSAQERLYMEYFANNDKYSHLNDAFVENLVYMYMNILKFLIRAHSYYTKGAAGDSFPEMMRDSSHKFSSSHRGCHHKP